MSGGVLSQPFEAARPAQVWAQALAVVLLAGCAVGPDYRRPQLSLPDAYPADVAAASTEPADAAAGRAGSTDTAIPAAAGPAVASPWWRAFQDPQLDRLIDGALQRNADLAVAAAQVDEAAGVLREAGAVQWPELDANASAGRSRQSQATGLLSSTVAPARNDYRIGLSTAFELDVWGRLRRGTEAARARLLASRYGRDTVALSLAAVTAEAYFTLRAYDLQVELTRSSLVDRDQTLGIVRRRVDAGYASSLDLAQAQGARATLSAQLRELLRGRAAVAHQLGQLTGAPGLTLEPSARSTPAGPATNPDGLATLPEPPPAPRVGVPSTLVERRPDVQAAEQSLAAANAQIGIAQAARLPTFSLSGSYGRESQATSTLLDPPAAIWSLTAGLVGPVLDAGKYAARTAQAEARQRQAEAAWRKSAENAFREVADALSATDAAAAAQADLTAGVQAAQEADRIARSRYANGYGGFLEVLDAQRTLNDANLAWVRNRQAWLVASVELIKAIGGGWQPEVGGH